MPEPGPQGRLFRFGPYEADAQTGELRKAGTRLKLQDQPFRVLLMLLERPGELVTREELQRQLWSSDTFVDFDHSLNTVVNKLRETLNDSASHPRFIETLARRGYRFIAPVEVVGSESAPVAMPAAGGPVAIAPTLEAAAVSAGRAVPALLTQAHEVPPAPRPVVLALFALIQIMYLSFYLVSLAKLGSIARIVAESTLWPVVVLVLLVLTAVVGIPTRLYLLAGVAFGYRGLGEKFRKLFAFLFPLDELWALAPFLLVQQIGYGLALAATAALLYVPFSQRTLILMAYQKD